MRPCCRIDQFGLAVVGGVVVELVVVVEVVDEELEDGGRVVLVPGRVVVVVFAVEVVVVDSTTVGSAPFRMPYGSLAPEAGLPARVGDAQVGQFTRF